MTMLFSGNSTASRALCAQSAELSRGSGNRWGLATALSALGIIAVETLHLAEAAAPLEESLNLSRQLGDRWCVARALHYQGELARAEGDYDRAVALFDESLVLYRQLDQPSQVSSVLHNLGYVAQLRGDIRQAAAYMAEALIVVRHNGDSRAIAHYLAGLAGMIGLLGQPERGARLSAAAAALFEATGAVMWPIDRVDYERNLATIRTQLGETAFAAIWDAGWALPADEAISEALATWEAARLRSVPDAHGFTLREQEVLRLLVEGHSNPEIAQHLFISRKTVEHHVTGILAKLGVPTRSAAVAIAVRDGLI
jgi:DNA-binding CsgD family transcriptional regulator